MSCTHLLNKRRFYWTKRLAAGIFTFFAASFFIFLMLRLNGSDAVLSYLYKCAIAPTDEAIASTRAAFGLDKPLFTQYFLWFYKAIHGDLGFSYFTKRPVAQDLFYFFLQTLKLTILAFSFTVVFSLILGILGAMFKDKFADWLIRFFCFFAAAAPNFWVAILLILLFSVKLSWLPPFGDNPILPAISICLLSIAINARFIRAAILSILQERFLSYARIRNLSTFSLFKHALLNALLPLITALSMHIGELFGGALVAENVFAYAGLGRYAVSAIEVSDYPIIQAFITLLAGLFIALNIFTDWLYERIDKRIKL